MVVVGVSLFTPILFAALGAASDAGPRCCFPGMPTTGENACTGDAFCAGPEDFFCGPKSGGAQPNCEEPDTMCQNCGCCPCCDEGYVGCNNKSDGKPSAFERDVARVGVSPLFNKGSCVAECPGKPGQCSGHGMCFLAARLSARRAAS